MASLDDCVPENALLSHDLFEGLHARVALVSDVEFVDEYPSSVLAHARRQHRWIRGDWQILFWLFPVRPVAPRDQAQHAAADRALEDSRQPAPQPRRADAARAAGRGWTVLPGAAVVLDAGGADGASPRSCCRSSARLLVGPRQSQSFPVFWRNLRRRRGHGAGAGRARRDVPRVQRVARRSTRSCVTLVRLAVTRRRLLEWETAAVEQRAVERAWSGARASANVRAEMMASPIIAGDRDAPGPDRRAARHCASASAVLLLWSWRRRWRTGSACPSARGSGRSTTPSARCCVARRGRPGATSRRSSRPRTAGCRRTTTRRPAASRSRRAADVADQHRDGPAVGAGRARSRVSRRRERSSRGSTGR